MEWIIPDSWSDSRFARPLLVTDLTAPWRFRHVFAAQRIGILQCPPTSIATADVKRRFDATLASAAADLLLIACANVRVAQVLLAVLPEGIETLVRVGAGAWRCARDSTEVLCVRATSPARMQADLNAIARFVQMLCHYSAPAATLDGFSAWLDDAAPDSALAFGTFRVGREQNSLRSFRASLRCLARDIPSPLMGAFCLDADWAERESVQLLYHVRAAMESEDIHPVPSLGALVECPRLPASSWRITVCVAGRSRHA